MYDITYLIPFRYLPPSYDYQGHQKKKTTKKKNKNVLICHKTAGAAWF